MGRFSKCYIKQRIESDSFLWNIPWILSMWKTTMINRLIYVDIKNLPLARSKTSFLEAILYKLNAMFCAVKAIKLPLHCHGQGQGQTLSSRPKGRTLSLCTLSETTLFATKRFLSLIQVYICYSLSTDRDVQYFIFEIVTIVPEKLTSWEISSLFSRVIGSS